MNFDPPKYYRHPVRAHRTKKTLFNTFHDGEFVWTFRNNVAAGKPYVAGDGPYIWTLCTGYFAVYNRSSTHVWICNSFDVAVRKLSKLEKPK